jgi:hypothetical protein
MVAAEPWGASHQPTERRAEPARLRGPPTCSKKSRGEAVELSLRKGLLNYLIPTEMDGSTEVAAIDAVREVADMLLKHLEAILNSYRTSQGLSLERAPKSIA